MNKIQDYLNMQTICENISPPPHINGKNLIGAGILIPTLAGRFRAVWKVGSADFNAMIRDTVSCDVDILHKTITAVLEVPSSCAVLDRQVELWVRNTGRWLVIQHMDGGDNAIKNEFIEGITVLECNKKFDYAESGVLHYHLKFSYDRNTIETTVNINA